ncbi:MAG: DedA family protein [Planctomycetaceae bacterium]|nr:DedA family protein [Planctomycetaceae bacterium]
MADSADPAPTPSIPPPAPDRNPLRRLYHWILSWANHPWGSAALAVFAFLDSFVFPIPPLFLQVALSLERPKRSFWYALVDTVPSVLGAAAGWYIGHALWGSVGVKIIGDVPPHYRDMLHENQFLWTLVYSFVPLPFKIITLGSGFLNLSIATLLIASTIGRSSRFFLLGAICYAYGNRARVFIEKHFNRVCLIGGAALALAVVAAKVLWKR